MGNKKINFLNFNFANILIVFLLIFLFAASANAAVYYVDQNHPNASDENPGTEELPWKTLIHGCAQLKAGDTLLVKEGVYASTDTPAEYLPGIRPVNSGTETNPIVIKAYPGHSVVIDGRTTSMKAIGGYEVSHIIYDGFTILYGLIYFNKCSHITVQNSSLR